MINVGPSAQTLPPKKPVGGMQTSHGFDPNVYRSGLSGQNRKDFDALGRNTKGDYAGWAKNAGFGKDTANAFNKRYKLPQTNMPKIGGPIYAHGPGSGAPPTATFGRQPLLQQTSMNNMGGSPGITSGGAPPMGPVQREWAGGPSNMGGTPMNGTAPNMIPGAQSMAGPTNLGDRQPTYSPLQENNMVQGPSFMQPPGMNTMGNAMGMNNNIMSSMLGGMFGGLFGGGNRQPQQQQPTRNRMAGGMVDPNFSRMMAAKAAGGMGSNVAKMPGSNAQHGPGAYGVSPELYYQHFDQQGMPKQQQQQPNLWQMYSQMLGGGGQQQAY